MMKSPSENEYDVGFDIWATDSVLRDIYNSVGDKDKIFNLLEAAFISGYYKGVVEYSNHRRLLDNETPSDEVYYMCKTDFECELRYAAGGNSVYSSVEDLKECRPCVKSCGIVAVKIQYAYTVEEGSE